MFMSAMPALSIFLQVSFPLSGICNSMSTDQFCVVFGNVHESYSVEKRGKNIIPDNKKWREKCDLIFLNATAATWSDRTVRAGKKELRSLILDLVSID
jgi:hypothetical protein